MGLLDKLKNMFSSVPPVQNTTYTDLTPAENTLLARISQLNLADKDITPELYQQLRDFEIAWLDRHYDTSSIERINLIPVSRNIPRAPAPRGAMPGHTGEVYYFLRHKAYCYEESGNIGLAIACMRKSIDLVKCRDFYSSDDCIPLAKMLARAGYINEAHAEMQAINLAFGSGTLPKRVIDTEVQRGNELRDFLWLQTAIPEKCPKTISSYRRMKTQNTKNYQVLQAFAAENGRKI